jgi:hypothetical protein
LYARAEILSVSSTILQDSGLISFQVYYPPSSFENITSTIPISSTTIACDSGNIISDSFCGVLTWLFVPSPASFTQFINLKSAIENKPPFGYFTAIKTSLSSLTVGTTSLMLVNASTTQAFSAIFSPLRTGLVWILWLMFAFWIFHRLRNLQI